MQYNHYPSAAPQPTLPSQSTDEYPPSYPDSPHHHAALSYAAVTPATHLSAGSIAHQSIAAQYPYTPYAAQPADHHSYYATPSQGSAIEHYPSSGSPPTSYPTDPSGHLNVASRHHPHLSQQQQQQQFIPTPVQTFQHCPSVGSNATGRSQPSIEPYYRTPNSQHVVHAPPASATHVTSGTVGRSNTGHSPWSCQLPHPNNHTGTIVVAANERYPCDLCDRSFTRLHDRRRHCETVHATSPVLHKCRYCRKDFSRADSLKRHIDNGCDEMPR